MTNSRLLAVGGLGVAAVGTALFAFGTEPRHNDVRAMFTQRCLGCHQPPDMAMATDRAWLGQVRETS